MPSDSGDSGYAKRPAAPAQPTAFQPSRRRDVPAEVRRLHREYRGGGAEQRTWRLYSNTSDVADEFTVLVGWANGTLDQLMSALEGWDVRVDERRAQIHVMGRARGLPPGFAPLSLPPGRLALPPGK